MASSLVVGGSRASRGLLAHARSSSVGHHHGGGDGSSRRDDGGAGVGGGGGRRGGGGRQRGRSSRPVAAGARALYLSLARPQPWRAAALARERERRRRAAAMSKDGARRTTAVLAWLLGLALAALLGLPRQALAIDLARLYGHGPVKRTGEWLTCLFFFFCAPRLPWRTRYRSKRELSGTAGAQPDAPSYRCVCVYF